MKMDHSFLKPLQRLREASRLRCIISVLLAGVFGILVVLKGQHYILTASVMKWVGYFLFVFVPMSLFFICVSSPLRSPFWFIRSLMLLAVPYYGYTIAVSYYLSENDHFYADSTHSLIPWALAWLVPVLLYAVIHLIGSAIYSLYKKDDRAGRYIYSLGLMLSPQLTSKTESRKARSSKTLRIIGAVLILITTAVFCLAKFLSDRFNGMDFETILFTIRFSNGVSNSDLYLFAAKYILFAAVAGYIVYRIYSRNVRLESAVFRSPDRSVSCTVKYGRPIRVLSVALIVLLFPASFAALANETNFFHYLDMKSKVSTIYEDHYVKPDDSVISFPQKKRNLIYIYLEAMETAYTSEERGGAQKIDYIPELMDLEEKNLSFSNSEGPGGPSVFFPNIEHTMGSTVAQTGGVALKTIMNDNPNEMDKYNAFLPSMRRLEDVLHENGYEQLYLRGEDTHFAAYDQYVGRYDDSNIFDVNTAKEQGLIPEDYSVSWGMEDEKVFRFAREKISSLAKGDKPFFVTLYTADTHSPEGGYRCRLCDKNIENDFLAAVRCSSRQVSDFIEWIKRQDFYENTTIIMLGDHLGIHGDNTGIEISDSYKRTTYNCIINAAKEPVKEKNRIFCSLDMFPTTLSAIGCEIKGDRLGLGTDLFSKTPTLCEELGTDKYIDQLERNSDFYNREFWNKE